MKLIENASKEKLRGGFYTPRPIADFILKWALNGDKQFDILEPSCGDGVFLECIKTNNLKYNSITAVEIDKNEANKACDLNLPNTNIINQDFYKFCNNTKNKFDLIIGNPPYVRYQFFDKKQRDEAEKIFAKAGLKYSKLTNAWVSFVVGSSLLLKDKGKIGFVLPAEILQVTYAKQLRIFLATFYNKINIISFERLVFPGIQQEVILLLCEKNTIKSHLIEHLELEDANALKDVDTMKLKSPKKKIDFETNKWTFYFLDQNEIDFIEKILNQKKVPHLKEFADVEVGMTTGYNKFFTVPQATVEKNCLGKYVKPMVGRSIQVNGTIFTENDWYSNVKSGARAYFISFPKRKEIESNINALKYIEQGEKDEINKGYKCGIRDEWQIVPSIWVSDALFTRRNNIFPKFVINQVGAHTTDTMHRVKINKNVNISTLKKINLKALVASYYNSLSLASAEICGRSHGGGALELMPNEVENILLPYNDNNAKILKEIDSMMREGKTIQEILEFTDPIILEDGYGFSESEIKIANTVWKKLLKRRLNRKGTKKTHQ